MQVTHYLKLAEKSAVHHRWKLDFHLQKEPDLKRSSEIFNLTRLVICIRCITLVITNPDISFSPTFQQWDQNICNWNSNFLPLWNKYSLMLNNSYNIMTRNSKSEMNAFSKIDRIQWILEPCNELLVWKWYHWKIQYIKNNNNYDLIWVVFCIGKDSELQCSTVFKHAHYVQT